MQKKAGSCNAHRCGLLFKTFPSALTALMGSKWGLWQHLLWGFSLHIDDLSSCHITRDVCLHIDCASDSNYKRRHQIVFFFYSVKIFHSSLLFIKTKCNSLSKCPSLSSNASQLPTCPSIQCLSINHYFRDGYWFLVACLTLLGEDSACKVLRVTLH